MVRKDQKILFQNKIDFVKELKVFGITYGVFSLLCGFQIGFKLKYFIYLLLANCFFGWVAIADTKALFNVSFGCFDWFLI